MCACVWLRMRACVTDLLLFIELLHTASHDRQRCGLSSLPIILFIFPVVCKSACTAIITCEMRHTSMSNVMSGTHTGTRCVCVCVCAWGGWRATAPIWAHTHMPCTRDHTTMNERSHGDHIHMQTCATATRGAGTFNCPNPPTHIHILIWENTHKKDRVLVSQGYTHIHTCTHTHTRAA